MRATTWEFRNRAVVFGAIFGAPFCAYAFDKENITAFIANRLGADWHINPDLLARGLFVLAALVIAGAALLRTWASAYLQAGVVYASELKSETLVADGPYRRVRNPLYLANVLMAFAFGSMMSRTGIVLCIVLMVLFCYRLIWREEEGLLASQGPRYRDYCAAVPRLWPALTPRIPSAGSVARWSAGLKAEFWYWGFCLAIVAFAITLNLGVFFAVTMASILIFWFTSSMLEKRAASTSK